MVRISHNKIIELLRREDNSTNSLEKGRALEVLICYIFQKVPGITLKRGNERDVFGTEEIDIAFWNDKHAYGFHFLPDVILVECKNWHDPVGSEEVSWFDGKIQRRGLDFGILVAANGITGDSNQLTRANQVIANALSQKRRLIVVKRKEIEDLKSTEALVRLIKEKLLDLAVMRGII